MLFSTHDSGRCSTIIASLSKVKVIKRSTEELHCLYIDVCAPGKIATATELLFLFSLVLSSAHGSWTLFCPLPINSTVNLGKLSQNGFVIAGSGPGVAWLDGPVSSACVGPCKDCRDCAFCASNPMLPSHWAHFSKTNWKSRQPSIVES